MRPGTCVIGGFLRHRDRVRCGMRQPLTSRSDPAQSSKRLTRGVTASPRACPRHRRVRPNAAQSDRCPAPQTTPLSVSRLELAKADRACRFAGKPGTLPPQSTPEATASPAAEATDEKPERKPDRAKYAAVDLSEVDEDFALQGEYVGGSLRRRGGGFGLQVVALGNGRFDAALLAGGLPGDGWDGVTRYELTGQRSGDWVTLEGDGYRAEVSAEQARLANSEGGSLAELHKVRRVSPREGAQPPRGAQVLFNGTSSDAFEKAEMSGDGLLNAGHLRSLPSRTFTCIWNSARRTCPMRGSRKGQ